ncbi:MAG: polysaccharide biosynthesis/export family protein [Chitinophagaceae bacterium]
MKLIRSLLLIASSFYLISCGTQQKIPNYLERVTDSTGKGTVQIPDLRIQKNDLLSIQVISAATRPDADAVYNLPMTTASAGGGTGTGTGPGGFLVDAKGNIEYPKLGTFHAEGLTKSELAEQIKLKLTEPVKLLENPIVIIRFQNLKITVLGEVNNQGVVAMPGEKITILEAIGLAGGLTDYGVKNSVKVMREVNGQREIGIVDLSSKDLFESPYYNLQQSDVVLVDPTKRKAKQNDQNAVIQKVSFGLSVITAIALLYNIFN